MVTKKNLSVLVWLCRNKKSKKSGLVPIYLRITINSESDELSSGRKTLESVWDNERKKVVGDGRKFTKLMTESLRSRQI